MHRGRAFERLRRMIAGGGCIKNCEIAGNNLRFEKLCVDLIDTKYCCVFHHRVSPYCDSISFFFFY